MESKLQNDYLDTDLEDMEEDMIEEEYSYMAKLEKLINDSIWGKINSWLGVEECTVIIEFNDLQARGMRGKYIINVFIKFIQGGRNKLSYSLEGWMLKRLEKEENREDFVTEIANNLRM